MLPETYYVGVYWGPRRETAAECAHRAARFFHALEDCDLSFSKWYRASHGRPTRGQPGLLLPTGNLQEFEAFLLSGRNRTDTDHQVIEELGFSGFVWNGRKNCAHLSLHCGGYSPYNPNVCVMSLPSEGEIFERMVNTPVLTRVLACMVTAWEPDWGVATSHPLREHVSTPNSEALFAGWLTWFSRRRGTVPPLPAPARIEPLGAEGTLVTLCPERPTAKNPEHLAGISRIHPLLDRAGLLRPLAS